MPSWTPPAALTDLLVFLIPDPEACRAAADKLRAEHPGMSPVELAQLAVNDARRWAAAAGGATGVLANPLVMVPAALADMAAILRIEGTMAGTVAAILDPITLNDRAAFDADVIAVVFPAAVSQALRQIGLRATQHLTRELVRKYLTRNLLEAASKFAAKRLFIHVSERAIVAKTVPLVGAGIGAGWNWVEVHAVGRRAIGYYQDKEISPAAKARSYSVRRLVRMLPWRKKGDASKE